MTGSENPPIVYRPAAVSGLSAYPTHLIPCSLCVRAILSSFFSFPEVALSETLTTVCHDEDKGDDGFWKAYPDSPLQSVVTFGVSQSQAVLMLYSILIWLRYFLFTGPLWFIRPLNPEKILWLTEYLKGASVGQYIHIIWSRIPLCPALRSTWACNEQYTY